jgi:hypothetical protein
MLEFDADRVTKNAQESSSEDLLDRITVYKDGMEPEALRIIEAELNNRGIGKKEIKSHAAQRSSRIIPLPEGMAMKCSYCNRPAVLQRWGWHRLWGCVPVFPRYLAYCESHIPKTAISISEDDPHPLE